VVYSQDLSFRDQIAFFPPRNCSRHARCRWRTLWRAGGSNDRDLSASYVNDVYARLSRMLGAEYRYVVGPDRGSDVDHSVEALTAALAGA
jgi:hypothetical protein